MIRKTTLGFLAAAALVGAGAIVSAAVTPTAASGSYYGYKPEYVKGVISKHCLDSQGGCAAIVM